MSRCDHAAIIASDEHWEAETTRLPTHPHGEAYMDEGEFRIEIANCRACRSTIARPAPDTATEVRAILAEIEAEPSAIEQAVVAHMVAMVPVEELFTRSEEGR